MKSFALLEGKKGLVFGPMDSSSIGWHIALAAYREGATLAISNVAVAKRVGEVSELMRLCGDAPFIACDASNNDDVAACMQTVKQAFGGVDFIVHSIGMSQNIRKGLSYSQLNYDWYLKTLDVSAISLHRILSNALQYDVINEGGSVVALTYIAAQRNYPSYGDMGDAKALLESIVRSYGPVLGAKGIRVNTVSQSPTRTRAGSGIENFEKMFVYTDRIAPLGNASGEECGDFVVALLSDLTRKVTMQNLFHDGGYSSMGLTVPMLNIMFDGIMREGSGEG